MDAECPSDLRRPEFRYSPPAPATPLRLREALEACSSVEKAPHSSLFPLFSRTSLFSSSWFLFFQLIESEVIFQSDEVVAPVTILLQTLAESPTPNSEAALDEIHRFVSSPDSNQMVVEALSLELPKLVIKFVSLSDNCRDIAGRIIEHFASVCNPREMLSVLCEALSSSTDASQGCYNHILVGLSKVLLRIQRRHIEQVKVALPIIIGALNVASLETDEEEDFLKELFFAAFSFGSSIQEICQKLETQRKEELFAILGLYVLQNIALISRARQRDLVASSSLLIAKFSQLLPFCGLSYFDLLTRNYTDEVHSIFYKEDDDDFMACFSSADDGACLAVIWGHISDDVVKAAGEQLDAAIIKIRRERARRWQSIGIFKHVLSCIDYPWIIKSHGIDVLLSIMDGAISEQHNHNDEDFSLPNIFASLKAIEGIMMGAPDTSLRKNAFSALRKVISDIPYSQRFDILKALITNSDSPSMIAIFIDLAKDGVLVRNQQENSRNEQKKKAISPFWCSNALGIVEMVLRPPRGGPPALPEHSESVLSALNLFRFIMIIELTGKTNHTGILQEDSLLRAYSEWLMPLRTLISRMQAENRKDGSEISESIASALSPVELVLYRCIELVEENLKHPL